MVVVATHNEKVIDVTDKVYVMQDVRLGTEN